jgi:hypothetical protein
LTQPPSQTIWIRLAQLRFLAYLLHGAQHLPNPVLFGLWATYGSLYHRSLLFADGPLQPSQGTLCLHIAHLDSRPQGAHQLLFHPYSGCFTHHSSLLRQFHDLAHPFLCQCQIEFCLGLGIGR